MRRLAPVAVAGVLGLLGGQSIGAGQTAIAGPPDRFDAVTGAMSDVLIRPADFAVDPAQTLVSVPDLLGSVDGARERSLVESLAFPRSFDGPESARQAALDVVQAGFESAGYAPSIQPVEYRDSGIKSPNAYVEVPGTQCPGKVLVVGAHYDSVDGGPGADDNASGVAAMLELARALHDHPLPVTVRLAAFSFEEVGFGGSKVMAAADRAAGTDLVGAVSFDMLAYTTPEPDPLSNLPASEYLVVVSDPDSAVLPNVFAAGALHYAPEALLYGLVIDPEVLPDINRSDHAAFERQGYDGMIANDVGAFRNPNYHRSTDTPDTLDWGFLERSTRALLAGAATFGSVDGDRDGTADVCQGRLTVAQPSTTTTTATTSAPTSAPPTTTPAPAGADAVSGRATYVG